MPRLNEANGGKVTVYKYENIANGKSYIGITFLPDARKREHTHNRKSSTSTLSQAFRDFGKDAFTYSVLAEVDTWDQACVLEKTFIEQFDTINNGYNRTGGGQGRLGHVGEKCPTAKLTEENVVNIIFDPCSDTEAAARYGTTRKNIEAIRAGRSWPHISREGAPVYLKNNHGAKVTEEVAKQIIADPCSNKTAELKFNTTKGIVESIRNGRAWKDLDRTNAPKYRTYREEINAKII